jgi:hypothetical protein
VHISTVGVTRPLVCHSRMGCFVSSAVSEIPT